MLLYICQDGDHPSGVATYGFSLLRHRPDARMLLLNADGPPRLAPVGICDRITPVAERLSHDPQAVAVAIEEMTEHEDRVLVLPNTGDTPCAAAIAWLRDADEETRQRRRLLGIVHSDTENQFSLAHEYVSVAPVWIGVSKRCADELRRRIACRGAHVEELPYPIAMTAAQRPVTSDGPLRLAYVGRLEETQKRVSRLVPLFEQLAARGIDFRATIAGDGPSACEVRPAVDRMDESVRQKIDLVGAVGPDVVAWIWRTHDVAVLVSAFEGMPLSLLEAMAAGVCPAVMTTRSGVPDLLHDGVNARLAPQGDIAGLADAIASLSRSRDDLARFQHAAAETAATFAPVTHFKRFERVVERCWQHPAPDPRTVPFDPVQEAVSNMVKRLRGVGRPVVVYGAGMFGRKVVDACMADGLDVEALIDSDPARDGWRYRGIPCSLPTTVHTHGDAVFAVGSLHFVDEITERLADELAAVDPTPLIVTAMQ